MLDNGDIISVETDKDSVYGSYYVCVWYGMIGFGMFYAKSLQATNGL